MANLIMRCAVFCLVYIFITNSANKRFNNHRFTLENSSNSAITYLDGKLQYTHFNSSSSCYEEQRHKGHLKGYTNRKNRSFGGIAVVSDNSKKIYRRNKDSVVCTEEYCATSEAGMVGTEMEEPPVVRTDLQSRAEAGNTWASSSSQSKDVKECGGSVNWLKGCQVGEKKLAMRLRQAVHLQQKGKLTDALNDFNSIIDDHPKNPFALYGKLLTLDESAKVKRSNDVLKEAIRVCQQMVVQSNVPKSLRINAGKLCAERQEFLGKPYDAMTTMDKLLQYFPDEINLLNKAGIVALKANQNERARQRFIKVLKLDAENGCAKSHLGFILLHTDKNMPAGSQLVEAGLASDDEKAHSSVFYYYLNDAYIRMNQLQAAERIAELGATRGVFLSKWQRSTYNVKRLQSKPWWNHRDTGHAAELRELEKHWKVIRDEGLAALDHPGAYRKDERVVRDGYWSQMLLYKQGKQVQQACKLVPKTCQLVAQISDATGCRRGQIKFSAMTGGTKVWAHCGPTNCRIRAHLGLTIPRGVYIRVLNETRTWTEGKFIILDDSYEHEVWHNGTGTRLILIVDLWHPQLTDKEKKKLSAI